MPDKPRPERIGTGMGAWSEGLESTAPDIARQLIAETEVEKYGGNIVVKKDGRTIIEMTTQGQGGVAPAR